MSEAADGSAPVGDSNPAPDSASKSTHQDTSPGKRTSDSDALDLMIERQAVLDRLLQVVGDESAHNVLLAGPWGSGKTTLLARLKGQLQDRLGGAAPPPGRPPDQPGAGPSAATSLAHRLLRSLAEFFRRSPRDAAGGRDGGDALQSRDYFIIEFSPWNQLGHEDPRDGFLKLLAFTVLELNKQRGRLPGGRTRELGGTWKAVCEIAKAHIKDLRTQVKKHIPYGEAAWILGEFILALTRQEAFLRKERREAWTAATPIAELLREKMCELLRTIMKITGTKRILLLVDDLDRTRPEYAVSTLESLYHLVMPREPARGTRALHTPPDAKASPDDDWPLTSVWAINIAMLEEFLYAHYRDQPSFDATAYLEKLFQRRINVPPLFHQEPPPPTDANPDANRSPAARLWKADLVRIRPLAQLGSGDTLELLARELNYAILGNLRLYSAVRRLCIEYWDLALKDNEQANPRPATPARLVRDARLMTLIQAFPGFREDIALYSGMWPEFINRVNERRRRVSFEAVRNPAYRHVDDPNLLTLLMDLEVLVWDERAGLYRLDREGETRLTRDLGDLLRAGF